MGLSGERFTKTTVRENVVEEIRRRERVIQRLTLARRAFDGKHCKW
jgi:hypothetical protein